MSEASGIVTKVLKENTSFHNKCTFCGRYSKKKIMLTRMNQKM